MSSGVVQANIVVRGNVQRVGYRRWAAGRARRLGLAGWVRNRPDRAVQVLVEGQRETIEEFIASLHEGPRAARAAQIEVAWKDPTLDFTGFKVRWF